MEIENQNNPPMVNEIIAVFLRKLDDILVRLDRIERRQLQIKENTSEAGIGMGVSGTIT